MSYESDIATWVTKLVDATTDHGQAIHDVYQHLENAGLISKVLVRRYLCDRNDCVLATVIRAGGLTLARTRDNKQSPGLNLARSVESARRTKTLDGNRHWPGLTFDVGRLAAMGPAVGIELNCRHVLRGIPAADVLTAVDGVKPGHPGPPTRV